ncbi:hypothetical protein J5X84_19350 [Streptosporangiaceae bacterium NEAU-GS5]|nr:hypothetical protein [Streptosporangiaceae bacterium NEAU-GS5]
MKSSEGVQIVAAGGATALRLLIATVVVTGAYVGASKAFDARAASGHTAHAVVLSARSVPLETTAAPTLGTVTVSRSLAADGTGATGCDQTYRAQSVVAAGSYDWRMQRWNSATGDWQTYLAGTGGFAGQPRTVRWSPRVVGNPGWYRVKLAVADHTYTSEKFQVSC